MTAPPPSSSAATTTGPPNHYPPNGPPYSNSSSTGIYVSSTMKRQQQPQNMYQQQHQLKASISPETAIPSSNAVDSAMFERDKQIYRCSTLRQGGKFDPKYKPSILNCPLPEIPKDADPPNKKDNSSSEHNNTANNYTTKTLNRPSMKLPPPGKAIPPPKIDAPISPPIKDKSNINGNTKINSNQKAPHSTQLNTSKTTTTNTAMQQNQINIMKPKDITDDEDERLPTPPPPITDLNELTTTQLKSNNNNNAAKNNSVPNSGSAGQIGTGINPNDDSNYAVTEL